MSDANAQEQRPSEAAAIEGLVRLQAIATCAGGNCPTVYVTDRDTVVVQGYAVSTHHTGHPVGSDELLVEIPPGLLVTAAQLLAERG